MIRFILAIALMAAPAAQAGPVPGGLDAVNRFRAQSGLPPVHLSDELQASAEDHARDMVKRDYFSHRGMNGSRARNRAQVYGYWSCSIGENIARGQTSLDQVMADWIRSPTHRDVLKLRKVRDMGLARAPRDRGDVWVLVLGAETC